MSDVRLRLVREPFEDDKAGEIRWTGDGVTVAVNQRLSQEDIKTLRDVAEVFARLTDE